MKFLISTILIYLLLITTQTFAQNYWEHTNGPYADSGITYSRVYCLLVDHLDYVYAGTEKGMYISTNFGTSWEIKSTGIENLFITSVAMNSENNIFAGSYYDGIYKTTDKGESWTYIGLSGNYISSIFVNDHDDIFVTAYGLHTGAIFRSSDNGNNWINVLPSTDVFCISSNLQNKLFAGTNYGLKYSVDMGIIGLI